MGNLEIILSKTRYIMRSPARLRCHNSLTRATGITQQETCESVAAEGRLRGIGSCLRAAKVKRRAVSIDRRILLPSVIKAKLHAVTAMLPGHAFVQPQAVVHVVVVLLRMPKIVNLFSNGNLRKIQRIHIADAQLLRPVHPRKNGLGIVLTVAAVGANHKVIEQRRGEKIVPPEAKKMRGEVLLPRMGIDRVRKDGVAPRSAAVFAGIIRREQFALLRKTLVHPDGHSSVLNRYRACQREIIELSGLVGWLGPKRQNIF